MPYSHAVAALEELQKEDANVGEEKLKELRVDHLPGGQLEGHPLLHPPPAGGQLVDAQAHSQPQLTRTGTGNTCIVSGGASPLFRPLKTYCSLKALKQGNGFGGRNAVVGRRLASCHRPHGERQQRSVGGHVGGDQRRAEAGDGEDGAEELRDAQDQTVVDEAEAVAVRQEEEDVADVDDLDDVGEVVHGEVDVPEAALALHLAAEAAEGGGEVAEAAAAPVIAFNKAPEEGVTGLGGKRGRRAQPCPKAALLDAQIGDRHAEVVEEEEEVAEGQVEDEEGGEEEGGDLREEEGKRDGGPRGEGGEGAGGEEVKVDEEGELDVDHRHEEQHGRLDAQAEAVDALRLFGVDFWC